MLPMEAMDDLVRLLSIDFYIVASEGPNLSKAHGFLLQGAFNVWN